MSNLQKKPCLLHNKSYFSAKTLFETGLYPQAIFFLQQSIEKGWKSFGFYYGIIDEEDARSREISHKGSRVANKTLKVLRRFVLHLRFSIKQLRIILNIPNEESQGRRDNLLNNCRIVFWRQQTNSIIIQVMKKNIVTYPFKN